MSEFLLILAISTFGLFLGCLTGLIPGLHVNTLSMILLVFSPSFIGSLQSVGLSHDFACLLVCSLIVSISITHTFVNIIPVTILGVPDEDTALTLLPAHRLLLRGRGYDVIVFSAIGSFGAVLISSLFLFPYKLVLGKPLDFYSVLHSNLLWILLAILLLMISTEGKDRLSPLKASFVIFLSGLLGLVSLDLPVASPFGLPSTVLFPLLAGLFGMSNQLNSLITRAKLKKQILEEPEITDKKNLTISVFTGSVAGAIVSVIPGITPAIGTILATSLRGKVDDEQVIITLSAVNTSCAFLVIVALFSIMKARSGAAVAITNLMAIEEWKGILPPAQFLYLMIPLITAGFLSYPLTCFIGKRILRRVEKLSYLLLTKVSIIFMIISTFIFTGLYGLLVLSVATAVGLTPIFLGVRRSNCMGVLLIPIMFHLLI